MVLEAGKNKHGAHLRQDSTRLAGDAVGDSPDRFN
jgi:hypothetical protein